MIRSAWPFSASRRSPLVSVSANSTLTTSSLIIVLALVGPRPVYSRNTPTASFEISAVDGLPARCSPIPTPRRFLKRVCRPREGKETMESHQQHPQRIPPARQRQNKQQLQPACSAPSRSPILSPPPPTLSAGDNTT